MQYKRIICGAFLVLGLFLICMLWPTNDDWQYLTAPYLTGSWWERMLPHAAFWRPWDALFGTFLNQNTGMFPTLNHVVIYAAHVMGTFLVFTILKKIWGGQVLLLGRQFVLLFFTSYARRCFRMRYTKSNLCYLLGACCSL